MNSHLQADPSDIRAELQTVCARFYELSLQGPAREHLPWTVVPVLDEGVEDTLTDHEVRDIGAHRWCLRDDHGHSVPILELAANWGNGTSTWVASTVLSHCTEAILEYGVRRGVEFTRRRGPLGQLRRTQSAVELGSGSEFHRRGVFTTTALNATAHSHGCTELDRRHPPGVSSATVYARFRRSVLQCSDQFTPEGVAFWRRVAERERAWAVADKCSVQASGRASRPLDEDVYTISDDETDRGPPPRPRSDGSLSEGDGAGAVNVSSPTSPADVRCFLDEEAEDAAAPRRRGRVGWRRVWKKVVLYTSDEDADSVSDSDPDAPGPSRHLRERSAKKRQYQKKRPKGARK